MLTTAGTTVDLPRAQGLARRREARTHACEPLSHGNTRDNYLDTTPAVQARVSLRGGVSTVYRVDSRRP